MINLVILEGNIGSDPIIRNSENGRKFVAFKLANDEFYNGRNGLTKHTTWHNISYFTNFDDKANSFKKGQKVLIVGKLRSSYNKDTQVAYYDVLATQINILRGNGNGTEEAGMTESQVLSDKLAEVEGVGLPDDLPF